MEKVEDAAFTPADRIGQLTMRNLDITDTPRQAQSLRRDRLAIDQRRLAHLQARERPRAEPRGASSRAGKRYSRGETRAERYDRQREADP